MQYSFFGSILTIGAMIGAITCGPIADYFGQKVVRKFRFLERIMIIQ
jgi:SP family facilitated glucose transporter-like MFS transporter 8